MQKMLREYWRGSGAGSNSCNEVEIVREFAYLGDRVRAIGGCDVALTARRCGWIKLKEFGVSLYGKRFPLKQKGDVYESYVRPAILHGSDAWCLKEKVIGIL